ncbi:MAG: helix-turn-helix domain containing protein [Thermocrispum sp.]
MTTIEERRTQFRRDDHAFALEVISQEDYGGAGHRVTVRLDVADADGRAVAKGEVEVEAAVLVAVAEVLADELLAAAGQPRRHRYRRREQPSNTGRPWTAELDADLEKRWIAGEGLREIAEAFGRTQSAILRRLPLIGCDPYTPGAYLPPPPSQRDDGS